MPDKGEAIRVIAHSSEGYIHELLAAFKEGFDDAHKEQKDSSYLDHDDEDMMRAYLVGWRAGACQKEEAAAVA